ncbi:hypothetical protein ACLMJK_004178 [Lecanora helva]
MTKKKNPCISAGGKNVCPTEDPSTPRLRAVSHPPVASPMPKGSDPSTSALIICRNKHWRYISSFHGPWLQLPPEILESLAYSNYDAPRPHPIDPAVFFDLVKIRRLVEEATDLAVRAANGTTSSALSNSLNAGNGILGAGSAAVLGLGIGGGGGPSAKLSRERKYRMREQATQKLSHAYQLDEIAASVATMQGASSLEEVAKLVLQRNPNDTSAEYVHFFHEKIPSRMLVQCTTLEPLNRIILNRTTEVAPLRTRAVTRIFKDDYMGAAQDLSEALANCRYNLAQHKAGRGQLELASVLGGAERRNGGARDWKFGIKTDEANQPSSLEKQLLFHRAGAYLMIACQNVHAALDGHEKEEDSTEFSPMFKPNTSQNLSQYDRLKTRKLVKTFAKRALRDYLGFLSHFDYTPGLPAEITEEFIFKVNAASGGLGNPNGLATATRLLEMSGNTNLSNGHLSDALIPRPDLHRPIDYGGSNGSVNGKSFTRLPSPEIHSIASLFSPTPPGNLPPCPATSQTLTSQKNALQTNDDSLSKQLLTPTERHEAVTYHPLLTDALHSLLLCHSLIQTSNKEHLRHAHMVARLARICDGYPIFLAARSPSRADWIEVLRQANDWIGVQQPWETLCAPAPLPAHAETSKKQETEEEYKERRRQESILEALTDDRVHDEASFQAAILAHEQRAEQQRRGETGQGSSIPKRRANENGIHDPIGTSRADAIARWVREAPVSVSMGVKTKKGPKTGKGRREGDGVLPQDHLGP